MKSQELRVRCLCVCVCVSNKIALVRAKICLFFSRFFCVFSRLLGEMVLPWYLESGSLICVLFVAFWRLDLSLAAHRICSILELGSLTRLAFAPS